MTPLAAPDELADFLGQLAGEGKVDSRGHFTLDLEKAREKLRRFQLPTPHHYVLCLLSSACLSGARTFKVTCDGQDTLLDFQDGKPFGFDDCKDLFGAFLTPPTEDLFRSAVRELALGVHGARGLDPEFICVESWGGREGTRLFVRGNSMEVAPLTECPFPDTGVRTQIHVRERGGALASLRSLVATLRRQSHPAEELVRQSGRYAETAVKVRGTHINITRLGNWPALGKLNPAGPVRLPELVPRKATFNRALQLPVPFNGYLGFGDGPGGVLVVVGGVLFQPELPLGYPTARVIVYAPHLAKDLSQTQLLQDEGYTEFVTQLGTALDALVIAVVEAGMGLAAWMEEALQGYLARCARLTDVAAPVLEANLVPLANQSLVSLKKIAASGRLEWQNPPGMAREGKAERPDGTLVLLRTPRWTDALDRFFAHQGPNGP